MAHRRTVLLPMVSALGLLLFAACDAEQANTPTYASAADQIAAEYGGHQVSRGAIDQVLEISKRLTLETRSRGIQRLVDAAKATVGNAAVLDEIQDFNIGNPLPGMAELGPQATGGNVGSQQQALEEENPNRKLMDCPPMDQTGRRSCYQLVQMVKKQALGAVDVQGIHDEAKTMIEQDPQTTGQAPEFKTGVTTYVGALGVDTEAFGIMIAAIRAEWALRDAGLCDKEPIDGAEIARLRGIEESVQVLREIVGVSRFEIRPRGADCLKIGAPGPEAELRIEQQIKQYVEKMKRDVERGMCADMAGSNAMVAEAYKYFIEGLRHGIDAQLATVWIGTLRNGKNWRGAQFVVANIDGCNAKDQITYTTSPLLIDLDDDGLQLSTERVGFDLLGNGQPQRVTWSGFNEGFLALDLDGDGQITSGLELFGDRSRCGAERCADGAEALALHDQRARGGNGDGRIDPADEVFASLRVWVDRNHDGRSQPDELEPLAAHGIRGFVLKPTYVERALPGGKITLTLEVETDRGMRTAYDVWFDNQADPGLPNPLF